MDRHVPAYIGTYLDWCVSPSLSNVAEVYSLAMLHYSGMAGPEMFDCSVFFSQTPYPPLTPSHLAAVSCSVGAALSSSAWLPGWTRGTQHCLGGQISIPSHG